MFTHVIYTLMYYTLLVLLVLIHLLCTRTYNTSAVCMYICTGGRPILYLIGPLLMAYISPCPPAVPVAYGRYRLTVLTHILLLLVPSHVWVCL